MSARASDTRAVRNSLAVLLRIAVLFALTILFLLPYSQGAVATHRAQPNIDVSTTNKIMLTCFL